MSHGYIQFLILFSIFFVLVLSLLGCFFVIQSKNVKIDLLDSMNEDFIERRVTDELTIKSVIDNYEEWTTKIDGTVEKLSAELVIKNKALDDNCRKMIEMQNTIDALRELNENQACQLLGIKTAKEACQVYDGVSPYPFVNIVRGQSQ